MASAGKVLAVTKLLGRLEKELDAGDQLTVVRQLRYALNDIRLCVGLFGIFVGPSCDCLALDGRNLA